MVSYSTSSNWRFVVGMFVFISFITTDGLIAAGGYTWVELGSLIGGSGIARGLSSNGAVAGRSGYLHGTRTRAFVWFPGSRTEEIPLQPLGEDSRALSISASGEVVGLVNTTTSMHAFLWSRQSGEQDLGALPDDSGSRAYAISDAGEVVGSSSGRQGIRAFAWTKNSGMQPLSGLPGATYTEALTRSSWA